ncbi:lactonase family protein [Albibacterium profundi]|uniref:Lactonase family protein n=1 Tax=Albibacterium profundi TaxID=3134906 RepID=A0ABV5CDE9_9SPHI
MRALLFVCILFTSCNIKSNSESTEKVDLLIGTYTDSGDSEGIYVYTFDTDSGTLVYKNKVTGIDNPSYLALSPDLNHVYAVSEWGKDSVGTVYAYDFDRQTGQLTFLNKQSSGGNGPCYVATDPTGSYVYTANYGSGSLAAIPTEPDGSLGSEIQEIYHRGNIVDGTEGSSRMHAAVVSPDHSFLFVTNLGTDKIIGYPLNTNAETFPLDTTEARTVSLEDGSGPRHFTFHPNGKYAYAIHELNGKITLFDYKDGRLTEKQQVNILPEGFADKFAAADIHISPDGKFLYGSNRLGLNEIVIFGIDPATGELNFVGRETSRGKTPRNFVIDPSGKFLLVANQDTNDIFVFRRDVETGLLAPTPEKITVGNPVCLKFVY